VLNVQETFRCFWNSLDQFGSLCADPGFREACNEADKICYVRLGDLLMSNPSGMEDGALAQHMREIGHVFPIFLHRSWPEATLDNEEFMLDRIRFMHRFSEVLLRRAQFVEDMAE